MNKKERVVYLDLIRVICFLMVTSFHFAGAVQKLGIEAAHINLYGGGTLISYGSIAVACFFMVSGASLFYQYGEGLSLKAYWKKRILGIFPKFYLVYLFAFFDNFYMSRSMQTAPKVNFLLTIIGMDGYLNCYLETFYLVGEWFLGAIIALYILFPLYRLIIGKCKYILPLVFSGASLWLVNYNPFKMSASRNLIICSMYFTIGMLLETVREDKAQKNQGKFGRKAAAIVGILLWVIVFLMEKKGYGFRPEYVSFTLSVSMYLIAMEVGEWFCLEKARNMIAAASKHSFSYFLLHHRFIYRFLPHFSGAVMNDSNTMLLFVSCVGGTWLLAIGFDKVYELLVTSFHRWRME